MDTKLKRSKIIFSFLCFFLSTTILICSAAVGIYAACNFSRAKQFLGDAIVSDYQETYRFKRAVSDQLQTMIDILCDGTGGTNSAVTTGFLDNDSGKNLLYQVKRMGSAKSFSNYDGTSDLSVSAFPDGYNFRLFFDGKKVTITKDGQTVDVYGNGTYNSDSGMWYVPGYSNLNFSNTGIENCRITILARKELSQPFSGNSSLYPILKTQNNTRTLIYISIGILFLGIILFAFYILFRKAKKLADLALARFSGWFWFEFKLLCTFALISVDFVILIDKFGSGAWSIWAFGVIESLFFYYLVFNDIRYNPKFYNHNIYHSAQNLYLKLEKGKPFQKQMAFRFWALLGSEILLILFFFLVVIGFRLNNFSGPVFLLCVFAVMIYLIYRYAKKYQNTVSDIGLLIDQISCIKNGDFVTPLKLSDSADLCKAADELNTIQSGFNTAVEERLKSERMKIDLITNVSHDIKTPLTSIISYIDLLKQEDNLPNHVKDYIQVLAEKSDRLKSMVQDVFDVSKATSGNMELNMEPIDLGKLLHQTMADMNDEIEASELEFKLDIPDSPVMISADGQRVYRVFQNLIENALQYSLKGTRIFITLAVCDDKASVAIKNISRFELDIQKDLTERFVRGDNSRSTGGSGLGLSIARSFTEACGGTFKIRTEADLFTVCVEFNINHK